MSATVKRILKPWWTGLSIMVILTVLLGIVYPVVMTGLSLVFPSQSHDSVIINEQGVVVGSALLGQSFSDAEGNPLPQYFQPRPSAAGQGYDGSASAGSNLGPNSPELVQLIEERRAQVAEFNHVALDAVPADAVTASGSGLDPDISVAYASIQVERVAQTRRLAVDVVSALVAEHTEGPDLGYIGYARINVLELNLALDEL
ncbi:MAG: potassium-transporting ATPase subunit KdpC [Propionibacteriaceae bacterium]|jgi:K+-transporting ATPase ATPase C chain|nr:potassium-transporting ATPase subunit KdpC [Propionibacteriaceae bacterium]